MIEKVTLIGLGLMASSVARGLINDKESVKVIGYDISPEVRKIASEIKIFEVVDDLESAVKDSDLTIICTPVGAIRSVVSEISKYLKKGSILSDVGSVKKAVVEAVFPLVPKGVYFVPAHPLAGTEESGPNSGFPELFKDRWCILTPLENTPQDKIKIVKDFWENLGSKVTEMTPEHHDLVLAVTSHAPHLIAYTMVGVADDLAQVTNSEVINFSAAGFRDFTRIAASDPTMWRDVFLNNKEAALEVLGRFSEELFALNRAIRQGDGDFLFDYFTRTRSIRRGIIEAGQDTKAPNFGR